MVKAGVAEAEVGQVVQHVLQSRENEVTPVGRILADEQAEGGRSDHSLIEENLGHGQLVQIGE
jgi:hypothetical protein